MADTLVKSLGALVRERKALQRKEQQLAQRQLQLIKEVGQLLRGVGYQLKPLGMSKGRRLQQVALPRHRVASTSSVRSVTADLRTVSHSLGM